MGLDGVDRSDRSLFRAGFPHDLFARLRREAPVWRHPDTPGVRESVGEPGFWTVSTMDLISLVSADGRAHRRLRGLINRGFTPRMIGRLEEQIRMRARAIVADLLERGECEF